MDSKCEALTWWALWIGQYSETKGKVSADLEALGITGKWISARKQRGCT
jgi:hypothetical protein